MIDGIIKAEGNSRLLKSPSTIPATWEDFRAALIAGTLPIDLLFNAAGWEVEGTPINKASLLTDNTAGLLGLDGSTALPDNALEALCNRTDKLMINNLLTALQLAANSSNIDAWCDLLTDESMIDATNSQAYKISNGKLTANNIIGNANGSPGGVAVAIGTVSGGYRWGGQTFIAPENGTIKSVKSAFTKNGSPTDGLICRITTVSGGLPTTDILGTSDEVPAADIEDEATFIFSSDVMLIKGTQYALYFLRTGSYSGTNYYNLLSGGAYADGTGVMTNTSGVWQTTGNIYFEIKFNVSASVRWLPVEASEALSRVAIVADMDPGDYGTITWYVSDDGSNWDEIEGLQEMYDVDFDSEDVYLKCVILNDAEISAVAWGGM